MCSNRCVWRLSLVQMMAWLQIKANYPRHDAVCYRTESVIVLSLYASYVHSLSERNIIVCLNRQGPIRIALCHGNTSHALYVICRGGGSLVTGGILLPRADRANVWWHLHNNETNVFQIHIRSISWDFVFERENIHGATFCYPCH